MKAFHPITGWFAQTRPSEFGRSVFAFRLRRSRFCPVDEPELNVRLMADSASLRQSRAWVGDLSPDGQEGKIHARLIQDCCFRYFVRPRRQRDVGCFLRRSGSAITRTAI